MLTQVIKDKTCNHAIKIYVKHKKQKGYRVYCNRCYSFLGYVARMPKMERDSLNFVVKDK